MLLLAIEMLYMSWICITVMMRLPLTLLNRRKEESCGIRGGFTKLRKAICDGFWMNGGESCAKQHTYRSILVPGDERGGLKLMQVM